MRRFFACIFLIAKKHAILVSQSRLGMKRGNYSERERERGYEVHNVCKRCPDLILDAMNSREAVPMWPAC